VVQHSAVADVFAKHFQYIYNNFSPADTPSLLRSSEFLSLAAITDADVGKTIKKQNLLSLLELTTSLDVSEKDVR
jgi:hypothetical protein